MIKGDILRDYRKMSDEDQRTFERWVKANAVLSSIIAAGLVAMAVAGSISTGSDQAVATGARITDIRSAGTLP